MSDDRSGIIVLVLRTGVTKVPSLMLRSRLGVHSLRSRLVLEKSVGQVSLVGRSLDSKQKFLGRVENVNRELHVVDSDQCRIPTT